MAEDEIPSIDPEIPRPITIPQLSEEVTKEIVSRIGYSGTNMEVVKLVDMIDEFSSKVLGPFGEMGERGIDAIDAITRFMYDDEGKRIEHAPLYGSGVAFTLAAFDIQTEGRLVTALSDPDKAKLFGESVSKILQKNTDNPFDEIKYNAPISETEQPFFTGLLRHFGEKSSHFKSKQPVFTAISASYRTLSMMWPILGIEPGSAQPSGPTGPPPPSSSSAPPPASK